MVHSLLDFSALEAGHKTYKKEKLEISEVFERLMAFVQKYAGDHIEIKGEHSEGLYIEADIRALEQVLSILIDNAKKYGEGDKRIRFSTEQLKNKYRIAIQDFGPGVALQDQSAIFDKFVRIGNLDEHNVKGHGIGLSIARAIIADHNAKLSLKSAAGAGATFYFDLPCNNKTGQ